MSKAIDQSSDPKDHDASDVFDMIEPSQATGFPPCQPSSWPNANRRFSIYPSRMTVYLDRTVHTDNTVISELTRSPNIAHLIYSVIPLD